MNQYIIDVGVLLILLIANGFLSMAEMAVVSSRRPRLQTMAAEGKPGAARALALAEDPGDFLSTVQIGITAIGIFTGVFSGARLAEPVASVLRTIPLLADYADPTAIFIVVLITTYLSLIVAELTPKRVALSRPEEIAALVAPRVTGTVVQLAVASALLCLLGALLWLWHLRASAIDHQPPPDPESHEPLDQL